MAIITDDNVFFFEDASCLIEIKNRKGRINYVLMDTTDYVKYIRDNPLVVVKINGRCKDSLYAFSRNQPLHRLLLKATNIDNKQIDHKNHDGLDNRKSNLRLSTQKENTWNQSKQERKTSSRYKGVHYAKRYDHFDAYINKDKKRKWLGAYHTEIGAAHAYNRAAIEMFGEFACLNNIDLPDDNSLIRGQEINYKKVIQLTMDGTPIKIWNSMSEAKSEGFKKCGISLCCRKGDKYSHLGFKWKYA